MNAVEAGIYQKLTGSASLTALLAGTTSVYYQLAPEQAALPYVVFQKQANVPEYVLGRGTAFENLVYLVKGLVPSTSASLAGTIAQKIDQALNGQTLTITGYTNRLTLRISDVDYAEIVEGTTVQHRGGSYRVLAQPS